MPTTTRKTRVEAIAIDSNDESGLTTYYKFDPDLTVNLRKGSELGGGDQLGLLLIRLHIDEANYHEVILDSYRALGSPIESVDLAIEQLHIVRSALQRIEDGQRTDEMERNAFQLGVEAHAGGLVDSTWRAEDHPPPGIL